MVAFICMGFLELQGTDARREKDGDLTQSYDKPPIPTENSKTKGQHTNATKTFDYTATADRLRTVSLSNNSSNWCG